MHELLQPLSTRAQQRPNSWTYTSWWPNNGLQGQPATTQQPDPPHPMTRPTPPINNPDLPSTMCTCHQQCIPAIGNSHLPLTIHTTHWEAALHHATWKLLWVCALMFQYAAGLFHKFFFRYLNDQRSLSVSNESCKLHFTMEGLQVVSIAAHLFQEGHSTALRCIASAGYAM